MIRSQLRYAVTLHGHHLFILDHANADSWNVPLSKRPVNVSIETIPDERRNSISLRIGIDCRRQTNQYEYFSHACFFAGLCLLAIIRFEILMAIGINIGT